MVDVGAHVYELQLHVEFVLQSFCLFSVVLKSHSPLENIQLGHIQRNNGSSPILIEWCIFIINFIHFKKHSCVTFDAVFSCEGGLPVLKKKAVTDSKNQFRAVSA